MEKGTEPVEVEVEEESSRPIPSLASLQQDEVETITRVSKEGQTQSDFIKNELNFDVDPKDPMVQACLSEAQEKPEEDDWMEILGNDELRKKVVKAGKEKARPGRTDICVLDLVGRLEDGTIVEEEYDFVMQLGDVDVVQGIDLAVALMEEGEEAILEVKPRFAYGSLGRKSPLPQIPPNAKIIYNITLKSFDVEPDIDTMLFSEKRKIGNQKRERGNWWFARNECTLATQCYRRALEYLSASGDSAAGAGAGATGTDNGSETTTTAAKPTEQVSDAELQEILEDTLKVHNNLAAAQLKCEAYDAALQSVENVLRCQPRNVKALYRKGKILHFKGEHAKACAVLSQALKIEPNDKAIQQELAVLKHKSAKDAKMEKNLYQKMLGAGTSGAPKTELEAHAKANGTSKLTWSLLGGTIFAVVGIIAYRFVP